MTRTHTTIDTSLQRYYNFDNSSYWVYSDKSGATDSLYITSFVRAVDTIPANMELPNPVERAFDVIRMTVQGKSTIIQYKISGNFVNVLPSTIPQTGTPENAFFYSSETFSCTAKEINEATSWVCKSQAGSTRLLNGSSFLNTTKIIHTFDVMAVRGTTPWKVTAACAWAPGVGLIYFEEPGITKTRNELKRYHVVAR